MKHCVVNTDGRGHALEREADRAVYCPRSEQRPAPSRLPPNNPIPTGTPPGSPALPLDQTSSKLGCQFHPCHPVVPEPCPPFHKSGSVPNEARPRTNKACRRMNKFWRVPNKLRPVPNKAHPVPNKAHPVPNEAHLRMNKSCPRKNTACRRMILACLRMNMACRRTILAFRVANIFRPYLHILYFQPLAENGLSASPCFQSSAAGPTRALIGFPKNPAWDSTRPASEDRRRVAHRPPSPAPAPPRPTLDIGDWTSFLRPASPPLSILNSSERTKV